MFDGAGCCADADLHLPGRFPRRVEHFRPGRLGGVGAFQVKGETPFDEIDRRRVGFRNHLVIEIEDDLVFVHLDVFE